MPRRENRETSTSTSPTIPEEALKELQAIGDGLFKVMQSIIDGECRNEAFGLCEGILERLKVLEKILKKEQG